MTVNTFFQQWKYPNRRTDTPTSVFDLPAGTTTIDVPSALTQNFRNFALEFLFSNVSASDNTLQAQVFRANSLAAFSASNLEALDINVTLDATNTNNANVVFVRDIKNFDNKFMRIVITAPAGVTAQLIFNLKAGTNSR